MAENLNKAILDLDFMNKKDITIDKVYSMMPDAMKNHSLRVSLYGNILYKKCLEKRIYPENKYISRIYLPYIKDIFRYHDIGKILLPRRVLEEGAEQNQYTYEVLKKHPKASIDIFECFLDTFEDLNRDKKTILLLALEVAVAHHERFDGRGYPEESKGEKIHILARMLRICDDYDNYVFKEYKSHEEAINEIKNSLSFKYDPEVGKVFVSIANDIDDIRKIFESSITGEEYESDLFSDPNQDIILEGNTKGIRERMKANYDLFKDEEQVRPIEFLYGRVLDIDSGYLDTVETNVVINDNKLGTLFPENYEPVALQSDRLAKLNRWAITEVGIIHESWEMKFSRDVKFSVRLCAKILTNQVTLINLITFLNRLGLDSNKIVFELSITDLLQTEDTDAINDGIELLQKSLNIKFILNGYDKVYNSIDAFLKYNFDILKIDYNLYRDEEDVDKRIILITNINDLCKNLGKDIIMTGVDTKDESAFLSSVGMKLQSGPNFGSVQRRPTNAFFKVNKLISR